jgi:hypothetical protein
MQQRRFPGVLRERYPVVVVVIGELGGVCKARTEQRQVENDEDEGGGYGGGEAGLERSEFGTLHGWILGCIDRAIEGLSFGDETEAAHSAVADVILLLGEIDHEFKVRYRSGWRREHGEVEGEMSGGGAETIDKRH